MTANRHRGFTLIELVVVLLILGIVSAAAAPRYFNALARFRVDATAKRVAADLEMARRQAKQTSATQTVEFYPVQNRYVLFGMADIDHPSQTYEVFVDDPAYGATMSSANFNGMSMVIFNMYGQPDNAGTVTIQSGGATQQVVVDASGAITLP